MLEVRYQCPHSVDDLTRFRINRPVGPGWDRGKGERLRDEVDHRYKCNYFKWASDVKRNNGNGSSTVTEGNVTYIGSQ